MVQYVSMKRLIPLVVFAVGTLFAAEPPRWLTISTLLGEREEEIAKDIRLLGKETIVDAVAFSCTLVPEGDPVVDKAALLAPRFRKMHELLKGSGVKEGILFQATMGHGWKPNSPAKGQKVILPDGNEKYKFCPLDKTFLDYIAGQAKTIGELKPDYFMVDDDTRLITGVGGCFCPLHLQAISAKSGKAFQTRQELQAALKADAALRAQWDEVLRDGIAELMSCVILSSVAGVRKPDAAIFQKAAAECGVPCGEMAYVGDTLSRDVLGCRNAGVALSIQIQNPDMAFRDAAFVNTGLAPDVRISDLAEIPDIIRTYNASASH